MFMLVKKLVEKIFRDLEVVNRLLFQVLILREGTHSYWVGLGMCGQNGWVSEGKNLRVVSKLFEKSANSWLFSIKYLRIDLFAKYRSRVGSLSIVTTGAH